MKATFTCKKSGNSVTFTRDSDIESMRKEEGYIEVKEESAVPETEQPEKLTKARGRPKKR